MSYIGINSSTGNHQVALIATPDSDVVKGNTSDMGGIFYLPSGLTIGNYTTADSGIPSSEWLSDPLGSSGGQDIIAIYRNPVANNVFFNQSGGTPIQLTVFDVIAASNPTSGAITLLENGDPNTSFYSDYLNINLGAGTVDAYSANNSSTNRIDFSTLSRETVLDATKVSIYPNPTSDYLNIKTNAVITSIEMFDLLGKSILRSQASEQIKINHLPTGVYVIRVYLDIGKLTKKIIID